jgi:phage-related tail fiber protein
MAINTILGNTVISSGSFPPARAATTGANITLSGLQTVDGITLVAGDRVLVKDQTDATTNGIYAATTGPWTRTTDAQSNTQFFSGMAVTVALGAVNGGQTFLCTTTDDPVVVGTSLITFASQEAVETGQVSATSTTSVTIDTTISAAGGSPLLSIGTIRMPAAAATIAIFATDTEVGIDTTSTAVTATLPSATAWASVNQNGLELALVDIRGNAAAHNITPQLNGADTFFYGGVTPKINVNFGLLKLRPAGSPVSGWYVRGVD